MVRYHRKGKTEHSLMLSSYLQILNGEKETG